MDETKSRDSGNKGRRKEKQKAAGCWSLLEWTEHSVVRQESHMPYYCATPYTAVRIPVPEQQQK